MSSDPDYDIVPANQACSNIDNKEHIQLTPGTSTTHASNKIDSFHDQQEASAQYDNVDDMQVNTLTGGTKHNYIINFKKNIITMYAKNEIEALKIFFKGRVFKKDNLIEIKLINSNTPSLYVIRGNVKNKFKKI
jgi:hypothetical protein